MVLQEQALDTIRHTFYWCSKLYFANNRVINIKKTQWKFSGDKHKSLQVDTERTFHQRYPLAML